MPYSSSKNSDITLNISLSAIANNYNYFKKTAKNSVCSAVVKANAYGLGVDKVAPTLAKEGCRDFFVANLDEAIELRKILDEAETGLKIDSKDINISVFHGVKDDEGDYFKENKITPVINNYEQLEYWQKYLERTKKNSNLKTELSSIIHIDSGINRLGFNFSEVDNLVEYLKNYNSLLNVKYIMSHLSCITSPEHIQNKIQLDRVKEIKQKLPDYPISFANSKATALSDDYHFDMVRPGSGLYGIKGKYRMDLQDVISIKGKILQIKEIRNEGYIGYGGTIKLDEGSRIAIVPIGYADGYPRINSNNIHAYYKGKEINQVGLISMDMTIFDISNISENEINIGDEIEIINDKFTVDDIAESAGTIGYEFLTRLGNRFKRVYV
jgi:alanine racemase